MHIFQAPEPASDADILLTVGQARSRVVYAEIGRGLYRSQAATRQSVANRRISLRPCFTYVLVLVLVLVRSLGAARSR